VAQPVILTSQEAEIRRVMVQSQPEQIVHETLSRKNPSQKKGWRSGSSVGPEFKLQYCKKESLCSTFTQVHNWIYSFENKHKVNLQMSA
jgi:hypothetical protein